MRIEVCTDFHWWNFGSPIPSAPLLLPSSTDPVIVFMFSLTRMTKTHTKRGKAFGPVLDKAICNAYLCISQDPIVGNSQPQSVFWSRVVENYVTNTGDNSRSINSIQCRWRDIQKACAKWSGYLKSVEALNQNGQTDSDRVEKANRLYYQEHRKEFPFSYCWVILQEHIKWGDVPNTKKKVRTPIIGSCSSPQSPDCSQIPSTFVSLEADDTPSITPSGGSVDSSRKRLSEKRKEKEAIRKSKIQEVKDSRICDLLEQFTKTVAEKNTIKAEKSEKNTELKERKVKALEDMTSIERRKIERKEKETEMEIMKMDLSDIENPRLKTYYNMLQNEILSKMLARQDAQAYHLSLDDD